MNHKEATKVGIKEKEHFNQREGQGHWLGQKLMQEAQGEGQSVSQRTCNTSCVMIKAPAVILEENNSLFPKAFSRGGVSHLCYTKIVLESL